MKPAFSSRACEQTFPVGARNDPFPISSRTFEYNLRPPPRPTFCSRRPRPQMTSSHFRCTKADKWRNRKQKIAEIFAAKNFPKWPELHRLDFVPPNQPVQQFRPDFWSAPESCRALNAPFWYGFQYQLWDLISRFWPPACTCLWARQILPCSNSSFQKFWSTTNKPQILIPRKKGWWSGASWTKPRRSTCNMSRICWRWRRSSGTTGGRRFLGRRWSTFACNESLTKTSFQIFN